MGKIVILDENTSNKIAAGEVIEKPASVIKELIENSIDAGAGSISVEIKNGGISFIKIIDNGSGIDEDDVEIAFERHATSKIRNANDLDSISTLGFRGEALASIAAVSTVEVTTRVQKNSHGTYIKIQGGNVKEVKQTGCPVGTTFVVRDLFYNTPARFKFLKKDNTEAGYISDIIGRIALANPHISFRLISNNSTVIHTPGNNDLLSTIFSIYGKETAKLVSEINFQDNGVKITGYAGKPEIARASRNHQSLFVNGRYVKSKLVSSAIDEAYKTFLLKNKFAFIVLNIELNPLLIDINVHPTKMEVRFSEEQTIFRSVYHAVNNALLSNSLVREVQLEQKSKDTFKFSTIEAPKVNYSQQNLEVDRYYFKETPAESPKLENKEDFKNNLHDKENNIKVLEQTQKRPSLQQEPAVTLMRKEEQAPEEIIVEPEPQTFKQYEEEAEKKQNLLDGTKIIGQAFSTYILLQKNDDLMLIDQHAAHERIMYEHMKDRYLKNESLSQTLISPVVIQLTAQEIKLLDDEKDFFDKLGFMYENFGNNSIILRSVPYTEAMGSVKDFFLEIVDYVLNTGKNDCMKIADDTIYTIACKAAVKANKRLDDMEIVNILNELGKLQNPYTCPHGRPTIIKLTKYELEKLFKRIV